MGLVFGLRTYFVRALPTRGPVTLSTRVQTVRSSVALS